MIGVPSAHIGGVPVEEMAVAYGSALFLALGAARASLGARLGALRRRARPRRGPAQL
jgi:hypothetical protein